MIDQEKARLLLRRNLSYAELSCSLGHLEMYETFLLSASKWGLFLEDDSVLYPSISLLTTSIPEIEAGVVLTLNNVDEKTFGPRPFPFLADSNLSDKLIDFKECALPPIGAFAYLMNREAANLAVHSLRGRQIFYPADFPFDFRNQVKFYASRNHYATVRDVRSTIEDSRRQHYRVTEVSGMNEKIRRRFRVAYDYSGFGVIRAKRTGLSGLFYLQHNIIDREMYKKFRKKPLAKILKKQIHVFKRSIFLYKHL
jgi:GR25 family glycosyltransferase involved in LPS biosynthesis